MNRRVKKSEDEIVKVRRSHLGRRLWDLNRYYKQITIPYIQSNGFPEFTEGQLNILAMISSTRPTPMQEIVDRLGVSKQAVSRMVALCDKNGYLTRVSSSVDARNKDLVFSDRGVALMACALDAIELAESEFKTRLGDKDYATLSRLLDKASKALGIADLN